MMKTHALRLLCGAALLCAPLPATLPAALAQTPPETFISYDNAPFGPGDRAMKLSVQLTGGESNSNTELWVIYGRDRQQVTNAALGGGASQGRVRLDSVNGDGVASGSFIFPHSDNRRPNMNDSYAELIGSGRTVFYKLVKKRGASVTASPVVSFVMPDKLTIVNFGDSYSSGEGSPYLGDDKWDNELCHRSGNSGQARAVATLKTENPGIAIAFKNVACSGAQIANGILLSQRKKTWFGESDEARAVVQPQLTQVRDWMADNGYAELNIAMVSGGGNDVDFGMFVEKYLVWPNEFKVDTPEFNALRSVINNDVPQLYRSLQQAFDQNFAYDRVLVSEYPDPMRGKTGQFCDAETSAMNAAFLQPLNTAIRTTISAMPKFTYVGGTMQASRTHGICNGETPYFNNWLQDSVMVQGDFFGIVHLNRKGHREVYQPAYEVQLRAALRDILLKWAKIKAKADARAEAAERQLAARTQLVQGRAQPLKAIAVRQVPSTIRLETADKAEGADKIAAAVASAKGKPAPSFGVADNRVPDDKD